MSVYDAGAGSLGMSSGYRRGARAAAGMGGDAPTAGFADVRMPGAIRDEILSIDRSFHAFAEIVARTQSKLPADFRTGWDAFAREWTAFANAHSSWLSNVWYASYQKALEYRERLVEWRKKFESITGVALNYPAVKPSPGPAQTPGIPWRFLAVAGAVGGGLYLVSKLFTSAAELKREFPTQPRGVAA